MMPVGHARPHVRLIVLFVEEPPCIEQPAEAGLDRLPIALRARLAARQDPTERWRSMLGLGLLREALRRLGPSAPGLEALRYLASGQPQIPGVAGLSIGHCPGRVVCAVDSLHAVGVDVEPLSQPAPARTSLYFSAEERAWIGQDPARALAAWTRKEAVAKAAGTGGLRDLPKVRLCLGTDPESDAGSARWGHQTFHTHRLDLGPGYVAHLATPARTVVIEQHGLGTESLL